MGYYTSYEIEVRPSELRERVIASVEALVSYNPFEGSTKWYDHEANLKTVSRGYPDVLVIIDGEGEEVNDKWRMFVQNGKTETHRMPEWKPPENPNWLNK